MRPLGSLQKSLQSLYRKALPVFRYITSLSLEVSTDAEQKSVERGCETRSAGYRAEFWRPARCDTTLPGVGFMAPPYGRLGQPSRPRQPCDAGRSPMWIGRNCCFCAKSALSARLRPIKKSVSAQLPPRQAYSRPVNPPALFSSRTALCRPHGRVIDSPVSGPSPAQNNGTPQRRAFPGRVTGFLKFLTNEGGSSEGLIYFRGQD